MAAVLQSLFLGGLCAAAGATRLAQRPRLRGSCLLAAQPLGSAPSDGALAGLTDEEASVVRWLSSDEMGQSHLFAGWESASPQDKRRLLAQVLQMDARYPEDAAGMRGLAAYIAHARRLLADSAADKSPFEGFAVGVPEGERIRIGSDAFRADERAGAALLRSSVFVLVAGGLGERLGFHGIKVSLPAETLGGASFLCTYATSLAAIRERCGVAAPPLVVMTSADTHDQTVTLLEAHGYFGLDRERVHFIQQANVPALQNNEAAFVTCDADPFTLVTKPHGHGDVHTLLHQSGLLPRFEAEGLTHLVFFQDTNVLAFKAIPAALGVSTRLGLTMNSLTVPRSPGEAAGAICKLIPRRGREVVINVEYNQLDALLRSTGGDTADGTGFSPYPGNVNTLILQLQPYASALAATGGSMPEFVNPKYADAAKNSFKKPTRLECMMQDLPKLLPPEAKVGFTDFERWFSFSPVKNNIEDAVKLQAKGTYAASPGAGEAAVYEANARLLRLAGAKVEQGEPLLFVGLRLRLLPAISLSPRFALTVDELMNKVSPSVSVSRRSHLLLDGDITLESLTLDGALTIRAAPGAQVVVRDASVVNDGWEWVPVEPSTQGIPEAFSIRGYALHKKAAGIEIRISEPGVYVVSGEGTVRKL